MYNLGDETYKLQEKFMRTETFDHVLLQAKHHIQKFRKKKLLIVLHGGEPLMVKKSFFISLCKKILLLEKEIPKVKLHISIQTNGVLINESWCDVFEEFNIEIGISIDGTEKAHDMYRKDHSGKGSYIKVIKGVSMIKKRFGFLHLVSVINVNESPLENYKNFKNLGATSINYLLTDYTHDNYPYNHPNQTPTSDWLIELFDCWVKDKSKPSIPFFLGLIKELLGFSNSEHNEDTALVIETNGEIEVIDSLKACGNAFTKNNLNIAKNSLDEIMNTHLGRLYFNNNADKLPEKCSQCMIKNICKGGRLVHRYSKKNGFNNPSVYCRDLVKVICHIQNHLMDKHHQLYEKEKIDKMDADEILNFLDKITVKKTKCDSLKKI